MDRKKLSRWMTRVSAASAWVFAAGLAPILVTTGPFLAMGVQIYGGEPEPNQPSLPFPWGLVGVGLAACAGLFVADFKKPERHFSLWALFASLGVAGVEVHHFLALVRAARP